MEVAVIVPLSEQSESSQLEKAFGGCPVTTALID